MPKYAIPPLNAAGISPYFPMRHPFLFPFRALVTAEILDGIASSGLSNALLSQDVSERMVQLQGEGFLEEMSDGILTSVFVRSGFAIWKVLKRQEGQVYDFKPYLTNAGIAVGTASAIESAVALAGS